MLNVFNSILKVCLQYNDIMNCHGFESPRTFWAPRSSIKIHSALQHFVYTRTHGEILFFYGHL